MTTAYMKICFLLLSFVVSSALCGLVIKSDKHNQKYVRWSELVGKSVNEASAKILDDNPTLGIKVYLAKNGILSTILVNTVILYEDEDGKVVNVPETVVQTPIEYMVWPDVIGSSADDAVKKILNDLPDAEINIVRAESSVDSETRVDKVDVIIDAEHNVVEQPKSRNDEAHE